MFKLPVKEIIVNADSQVRLLNNADGAAYTGSTNLTPTTGAFQLEGFLSPIASTQLQLLTTATRIRKTSSSAGVTAKVAYTITAASGGKAGDTYRVVTDSLDLTPTEYQNRPTEKRYQLSVDCANAGAVATELVARINADPKSQVIAYKGFNNASPLQDDSTKIVLVGKTAGVSVALYVGEYSVVGQTTYSVSLAKVVNNTTVYHTAEDTSIVTVDASLPVGTYDALKNINWAKNFSIDQNINWMPLPGSSYNSYYFEVNKAVDSLGNDPIPNEKHADTRFEVRVYVKSGLTLDTALDALTTDMNV